MEQIKDSVLLSTNQQSMIYKEMINVYKRLESTDSFLNLTKSISKIFENEIMFTYHILTKKDPNKLYNMNENLKKNLLLFKDNFCQIVNITVDFIYEEIIQTPKIELMKLNYSKVKILNDNILKINEDSQEFFYDSVYDSIFSTQLNFDEEKYKINNKKINFNNKEKKKKHKIKNKSKKKNINFLNNN